MEPRWAQDTECGPGISHVREIDEPRYDRHAGVQRQRRADEAFGELIDGNNQDRQPELEPSPFDRLEARRAGGIAGR